jgi:RND family efflux transporter MFP subunit
MSSRCPDRVTVTRTLSPLSLLLAGTLVAVAAPAQELSGFDCLIEPYAVMDVSTREEGILETILVERGDVVKRAQALARLDSVIEEATVELARARANMDSRIEEQRVNKAFAARQRTRAMELYQKKAIPFHEVDKSETEERLADLRLRQAENDKTVATLELKRAQELLKLRTVRSPVNGVVVERLLYPGESVKDEPIVRVAQIDPLNVEIIVPVTKFGRITSGMKAQVTPLVPGAGTHTATVTIVDRVVDAASGTFGVRLKLPNADYRLPGGLKCRIRFLK